MRKTCTACGGTGCAVVPGFGEEMSLEWDDMCLDCNGEGEVWEEDLLEEVHD